jgi:hypothetical protein
VQHDDLHMWNVYARGEQRLVLDWGDSCVSHPFMSLVETYRFVEHDGVPPGDPLFTRIRDVYLEPWGSDLVEEFALAQRVGSFAHSIAWARQRDFLPQHEHADFDTWFRVVLRRAVARIAE